MEREQIESLNHTLVSVAAVLRDLADRLQDAAIEHEQAWYTTARNGTMNPLAIDRSKFSVVWNGRECVLGATISFRLLERLARRPNQYTSHSQLLDDVWGGTRSISTIRSAVGELRGALQRAGLSDLAAMIDGQHRGHYGLMLP